MIIFPAIDIIGGKPVRLYKGDFSTAKQVVHLKLLRALLKRAVSGYIWLTLTAL